MAAPRVRSGRRWLGLALATGAFGVVVGAGAAAAAESDTVGSYWRGVWWSVSLVMSEGFVDEAPRTTTGAVISVVLMLTGFVMLSVVSAGLASIFVRSDERPREQREVAVDADVLAALHQVLDRLDALERRLDDHSPPAPDQR